MNVKQIQTNENIFIFRYGSINPVRWKQSMGKTKIRHKWMKMRQAFWGWEYRKNKHIGPSPSGSSFLLIELPASLRERRRLSSVRIDPAVSSFHLSPVMHKFITSARYCYGFATHHAVTVHDTQVEHKHVPGIVGMSLSQGRNSGGGECGWYGHRTAAVFRLGLS